MNERGRSVTLFVEGGAKGRTDLNTECRRGFRRLLERAGVDGRSFQVIACGSRSKAFENFGREIRRAANDPALAMLLVDSEAPVHDPDPWLHVLQRTSDRWQKPEGSSSAHLHLMVECMEAWFLADPTTLASCFGKGFVARALPQNPKIESIPKTDVLRGLERATRRCGRKWRKRESFQILGELDPTRIRQASPWAERFFATVARPSDHH